MSRKVIETPAELECSSVLSPPTHWMVLRGPWRHVSLCRACTAGLDAHPIWGSATACGKCGAPCA